MDDYSNIRIKSLDPAQISAPRNVSAAAKRRCRARRELEARLENRAINQSHCLDYLFKGELWKTLIHVVYLQV